MEIVFICDPPEFRMFLPNFLTREVSPDLSSEDKSKNNDSSSKKII
jgi:hypothetical protein